VLHYLSGDLEQPGVAIASMAAAPDIRGYGGPISGARSEYHRTTVTYGVVKAQATFRDSLLNSSFHVRVADPNAALKLDGVTLAKDGILEYGTKYPWTQISFKAWLPKAAEAGAANSCKLMDLSFLQDLAAGSRNAVPEAGCTKEVWEMYWKHVPLPAKAEPNRK
jgi:hypothetical protein